MTMRRTPEKTERSMMVRWMTESAEESRVPATPNWMTSARTAMESENETMVATASRSTVSRCSDRRRQLFCLPDQQAGGVEPCGEEPVTSVTGVLGCAAAHDRQCGRGILSLDACVVSVYPPHRAELGRKATAPALCEHEAAWLGSRCSTGFGKVMHGCEQCVRVVEVGKFPSEVSCLTPDPWNGHSGARSMTLQPLGYCSVG